VTAADWETAALDALAEGGVSAIAIASIAARLGATKGTAALRRGSPDLAVALDANYAETWLAILGVPP
jgi:hypothetical protein